MNTKRVLVCSLLLVALLLWRPTAQAWGPRTQVSVVTNALYMLSKDGNIPLTRLERDLRAGAMTPIELLEEEHPGFRSNPAGAIESEMRLLRQVRGDRVDAYFAYRLGMLGKMIAIATAPMRDTNPAYRETYYNDVDQRIQGVSLRPSRRAFTDPRAYLDAVMAEANANNDAIARSYQTGAGFSEIASMALPEDITRSVRAVADVWRAILTGTVPFGDSSEGQLQRYVLGAFDFYITRRNVDEIEAAAARLAALTPFTPDMRVRIGDMLYDAGFYERAMEEYEAVRRAAPERRDVIEKIAEFYVNRGHEALEKRQLESARDAFDKARNADPLHPTAERDYMLVEAMILARDSRQAADREALRRAGELETRAEQEAVYGRYAEAIAILNEAEKVYASVSDEFPLENQQRIRGLNNIRYRTQELKQEITVNAQLLSGAGFAPDAVRLARRQLQQADLKALQELITGAYEEEIRALQARMQSALSPP